MTKEERIEKIKGLKSKAVELKKEIDYYNALQLALKLVLNGSYGALSTQYFVLYNNHVAGTITAEGRELTKTMDKVNEEYWYNQWHLDYQLHKDLFINEVSAIDRKEPVSIYGDTDSIFVSFKPAMDHCEWKDQLFNKSYLSNLKERFVILTERTDIRTDNPNLLAILHKVEDVSTYDYDVLLVDGHFVKERKMDKLIKSGATHDIRWNWSKEVDFIQGVDKIKYEAYFRQCLDDHAHSYGVENKEVFELERISESIISIAKKKYIQHIVHEDGIDYNRLDYLYPKGVELVRSSTPAFARDKIVGIVKYLFANPDTFNIRELLRLVKNLRKEFELADVDDIAMQSSCSNYDNKVIDDKNLPLQYVTGAHFAVKASAYYNYLLHNNKDYQEKYEFLKSGTKIKYYVVKDTSVNNYFAYIRGSYPMEFAPEIDYDTQFEKAILSPINSIISPLGMPEITKRLSVVMDIFSGF